MARTEQLSLFAPGIASGAGVKSRGNGGVKVTYFHSAHRRFQELVVFVPFFGSHERDLQQHLDMVNELGYDAVAFDFAVSPQSYIFSPRLARKTKVGLLYLWADEIEDVLDSFVEPKILYTFSGPAAAAFHALVARMKRESGTDVKAMICDSGPFLNIWGSIWSFLKNEYKIPFIARVPALFLSVAIWGHDHADVLQNDLHALPSQFPILSIRGWNDPLIPPSLIDEVFESVKQINLQVFALPEASHLDGLRLFKKEYSLRVQRFLEPYSSVLNA